MLDAMPLPDPDPAPFDLPGARASALYLHGYTSTPWEVRPAADALAARGVGGHGLLLPGHGTRPDELNHVTRGAWRDATTQAFDALPPDRPRVVVGSSMGGLLALILAAERAAAVDALVLFAPALELFPSGIFGGAFARAAAGRGFDDIPKAERGGDIADPEARALNPSYDVLPLDGLAEFDRLRGDARAVLADVRCPVLVLHGALDRTVRPSSSRLVVEHTRAPFVERELLVRSRHVIGVDVERHRVAARTVAFVERVLAVVERAR